MAKKTAKKPAPAKGKGCPKWTQTIFGFAFGDLIEVVRRASSHDGERRQWAAIDVLTKDGGRVTIHATARTSDVKVTPAGGRAKRGK